MIFYVTAAAAFHVQKNYSSGKNERKTVFFFLIFTQPLSLGDGIAAVNV